MEENYQVEDSFLEYIKKNSLILWIDNVPPGNQWLPNKKSIIRYGIPPRELLVRCVSEAPQTTQLLSLPSCPPVLNGKTLLLKSWHTLVRGHGEIKLVLTRKLLPWCPAFIVLEGTVEATWKEKSPTVLSSWESCKLH